MPYSTISHSNVITCLLFLITLCLTVLTFFFMEYGLQDLSALLPSTFPLHLHVKSTPTTQNFLIQIKFLRQPPYPNCPMGHKLFNFALCTPQLLTSRGLAVVNRSTILVNSLTHVLTMDLGKVPPHQTCFHFLFFFCAMR